MDNTTDTTDDADRFEPRDRARAGEEGVTGSSRREFLKVTTVAGAVLAMAPSIAAGAGSDSHIAVRPTPRLSIDGNELVTPDGDPVTLRGLNTIDPKRANETAADRGKDAEQLVDLLTDPDRGWHTRVLRIPVQPIDIGGHEPGYEAGPPEPIAFTQTQLDEYLEEHLDPVVDRVGDRGVYAIVDFHRHWTSDDDSWSGHWADEAGGEIDRNLQAETVAFWETVAPRYADEDHVLYELYNEPTLPGMWDSPQDDEGGPESARRVWKRYLEFAQPIVDTIRTHADNVVLVGSPGWSQSPEGALVEPVDGENIAYTYHIYPGHAVSEAQAWDDSSIDGQGVDHVYEEYPLFVTEFGWQNDDDGLLGGTTSEFGEAFVEWLESHDSIHWTAWCADVWWEPAMFEPAFDDCDARPCEWNLLGRDAGSKEDMGEYVRQALEQEGVPEGYWEDDESAVGTEGEDDPDDDGSQDDEASGGDEDDQENGNDHDGGDSVPGFGVLPTVAGVTGGVRYALRRRDDDHPREH